MIFSIIISSFFDVMKVPNYPYAENGWIKEKGGLFTNKKRAENVSQPFYKLNELLMQDWLP
jgi:hypothetical protein